MRILFFKFIAAILIAQSCCWAAASNSPDTVALRKRHNDFLDEFYYSRKMSSSPLDYYQVWELSADIGRFEKMDDPSSKYKHITNKIHLGPDAVKEIEEFESSLREAIQMTDSLLQVGGYNDETYRTYQRRVKNLFTMAGKLPPPDKLLDAIKKVDDIMMKSELKTSDDAAKSFRTELVEAYLAESEYSSVKQLGKELQSLSNEVEKTLQQMSPQAKSDHLPIQLRKMIVRLIILPLKFESIPDSRLFRSAGDFVSMPSLVIVPAGLALGGTYFYNTPLEFIAILAQVPLIQVSVPMIKSFWETRARASVQERIRQQEARFSDFCNLLLKPAKPKQLEPIEQISDQVQTTNSSRQRVK